MSDIHKTCKEIQNEFYISEEQINKIADDFKQAMTDGLRNKKGPLKMLPSFMEKPTGKENGRFLALDFGGTNVRLQIIYLTGDRRYYVHKEESFLLKSKDYDLTASIISGKELFNFVAHKIKAIIEDNEQYILGHTFSFPCQQIGPNNAILLQWTKEIETTDVVNKDINRLLQDALEDNNLKGIIPKAIINDTVGTLLTAVYEDDRFDIGSIIGTGHNTCYLEQSYEGFTKPVIVNIESGNFNKIPLTRFDKELDAGTKRPLEQQLEKIVGGNYIGELVRIVLSYCLGQKAITDKKIQPCFVPNSITGKDLSIVLNDTSPDLLFISDWLQKKFNVCQTRYEDRYLIKSMASIVTNRSAQIAAGTYIGILKYSDPYYEKEHSIAIDGSVYEFLPGFADSLANTLRSVTRSENITVELKKNGSCVGAAIAAAMHTGTL